MFATQNEIHTEPVFVNYYHVRKQKIKINRQVPVLNVAVEPAKDASKISAKCTDIARQVKITMGHRAYFEAIHCQISIFSLNIIENSTFGYIGGGHYLFA